MLSYCHSRPGPIYAVWRNTPHCAHRTHRTTSRRERQVTGHFTPSPVCPIGRIQRFLNVSCLFS